MPTVASAALRRDTGVAQRATTLELFYDRACVELFSVTENNSPIRPTSGRRPRP
jgi:hypothetical protein